jgi:hypothetical protein
MISQIILAFQKYSLVGVIAAFKAEMKLVISAEFAE